jgi:hypothetical protein
MPALSQALEFITYTNTASVQVVYPNSATNTMVYISDKIRGDGYFGSSDGLHTAMVTATDTFVGTATIQASLATNPSNSDWFNVNGASVSYTVMNQRTSRTVDCFNFTGNFVWIRGVVQINAGSVESILVNH